MRISEFHQPQDSQRPGFETGAECFHAGIHRMSQVGAVLDVAAHGQRLAAPRFNLAGALLKLGKGAPRQGDANTSPPQRKCNPLAHALPRSGDQGRLALQFVHHRPWTMSITRPRVSRRLARSLPKGCTRNVVTPAAL